MAKIIELEQDLSQEQQHVNFLSKLIDYFRFFFLYLEN